MRCTTGHSTTARAGTVELVSSAAASPGCRLAIRTSASPAVRGDLRYARFNVDHKTGAISVTTLGVPGVRVQVRITAVPTQAHGTPASWARTWYSG